LERSDAGKWMRLASGWRGWLFVLACAAVPAGILFHEPFVRTVILPMLHDFGVF
jgi:hypothetical protein